MSYLSLNGQFHIEKLLCVCILLMEMLKWLQSGSLNAKLWLNYFFYANEFN